MPSTFHSSFSRRELFKIGLAASAIPAWAFAKEFWDAKPAGEWTPAEIDRLLTKSPWAKEASISYNGGPGTTGSRGGRRRMGGGGIGYPGGGIGFPGGTYPGGTYPGGYPPGGAPRGGTYPGSTGDPEHYTATVRWESALPIQDALHVDPKSGKPDPQFARFYVIQILGNLPDMGAPRMKSSGDDADVTSRDEDAQNERRLDMFRQYTKIEKKDGFIGLEKVEQGSRTSSLGPGTLFYFSRNDEISADDRLLTFVTKMGPIEIKAKFTPREMMYHGRVAV